jgi:hypothetical protein
VSPLAIDVDPTTLDHLATRAGGEVAIGSW